MSRYGHNPTFNEFFGVDLRSSEKTRTKGFSGDGSLNCLHSPQGGIGARPGTKNVEDDNGQLGIFAFRQVNILGTEVERLIGFGSSNIANSGTPRYLVESTFTLTNSHATLAATVSMKYDTATSQFRFVITRGGVTLLSQALGTGGGGSATLAGLELSVDALASFSMSTPSGSSLACQMQMLNEETVAAAGGTLTVKHWYWTAVAALATNDASIVGTKHWAYELGIDSYRNVSGVLLNGVLYVAWGSTRPGTINGNTADSYGQIWKYDGQNFYAIGAPLSYVTASLGGAVPVSATDCLGTRSRTTPLPGSAFKYRIRQVVIDKAGNRVEGDLSEPGSITGNSVSFCRVQLQPLAANVRQGSKCGYAQKNGVQTTATPNVDGGHSMVTGDIAFFYDAGQGRCIQREVTATSGTSLALSTTSLDTDPDSDTYDTGATPQFLDNAIITNNIRCEIYRTKAGGTEYYFLAEVPASLPAIGIAGNESSYIDEENIDSNLTDALIEPIYPRSYRASTAFYDLAVANSPAARYLAKFNSQLIAFGDDRAPRTIYFSDIDGPEYFPKGTHNFELPGTVTAVAQCGDVLLAFTETSTHAITGDLANFNFRVDEISSEIGCTSHHSIQQLEEGVVAWQSARGPYISFGGRRVEPLGPKKYTDGALVSRIEPFFTKKYSTTATQPAFKRSQSALLPKDRLYLLYVPFEDPSKPGFGTSSDVIWAYDYGRGIWWQWSGLNCSGGMAVLGDLLYFQRREHNGSAGSTFSNIANARLSQQQRALARTNSSDTGLYNYADHDAAITWRWKAHWETLGRPSNFKRFLRNKLSSDETRAAASTPMTAYAYFDWDETRYWSDTVTWTTQKSVKLKLRAETCQAMMVVFEQTATYHAPPLLTGYELEAVANFKPMIKE